MNYKSSLSSDRPALSFSEKQLRWLSVRPRNQKLATLEYHALKYVPEDNDLENFESLNWRQRQLLMARLRRLESEVNLKALALPVALISAAVVLLGIQLRELMQDPGVFYMMMAVAFGFLALFGMILIALIRVHTRKEACLTAWIEAFKDSHALRTKIEEEGRKTGTPELRVEFWSETIGFQ